MRLQQGHPPCHPSPTHTHRALLPPSTSLLWAVCWHFTELQLCSHQHGLCWLLFSAMLLDAFSLILTVKPAKPKGLRMRWHLENVYTSVNTKRTRKKNMILAPNRGPFSPINKLPPRLERLTITENRANTERFLAGGCTEVL